MDEGIAHQAEFFSFGGAFLSCIVNKGNSKGRNDLLFLCGRLEADSDVRFRRGRREGACFFQDLCGRDCEFFFRVMDMDPVWYAGCVHACGIPQKLRVRGATLPRWSSDGDVSVSLVGETSSLSHSPRVCDVEPAGSPGSRLAGDR